MGPFNALTGWLFYFAPSLIAWYRAKHGKPIVGSVRTIFIYNLVIGWSGVGWVLMLANAFGKDPVAWFLRRYVHHFVTSGPAPTRPQGGLPYGTPAAQACGQCGGSGTVMCSSCSGRGSWYNPPSGASGTAQLQTCPACASSGRLRCPYCGGSGRVAGPIG